MNADALLNLCSECESLTAQADVLLAQEYQRIDPEMAAFIGNDLDSLRYDFYGALEVKSYERQALLGLITGEMRDLVYDLRCRIAQAEAIEAFIGTVRLPFATITLGKTPNS